MNTFNLRKVSDIIPLQNVHKIQTRFAKSIFLLVSVIYTYKTSLGKGRDRAVFCYTLRVFVDVLNENQV